MAIRGNVGLPRQRIEQQTGQTPAHQNGGATNAQAPVGSFHRKGDADNGGNNGGGQQNSGSHQSFDRGVGARRPAETQRFAPARHALLADDHVFHNIRGANTFDANPIRRKDFEPGGKMTSTEGHRISLAGDVDADLKQQISDGKQMANQQVKNFNPLLVANGYYSRIRA